MRDSDEVTVLTAPAAPVDMAAHEGARKAHLIVLSGASVGKVYPVEQELVVLGRDATADIQLMDPGISRRHAAISQQPDGGFAIRDAGSRNGTYANNRRLDGSHDLADGDKVQLGLMTILKFCLNDAFEAQYAQRMYDAALRDDLTGAFNRRYFDQRLLSEFAFAKRHGTPLSLLMLDIDHFKQINDTKGHLVGDHILRDLSERIATTIRVEDVLARYGGEEFAVLCRDTDLRRAAVLAERIRHAVDERPFDVEGEALAATLSVGVASVPDSSVDSPRGMIEAADQALYQAKKRGRNCVIARRSREG